jgi:hypothetical protein
MKTKPFYIFVAGLVISGSSALFLELEVVFLC